MTQPPRNRRWQWAAVVAFVAVVAIAAIAVGGIVVGTTGSSILTGTPTMAPRQERSDEDQLRDAIDEFEQAWNASDFDALRQLICADLRADDQFSRSELREARDLAGRLALTVRSIDFDGAKATAVIENHGAEPDDIRFVRESDDWKWCEP
jgi:sigma54-dependent transcription regulator